ncbi:MAG: FAD-dependent oxidoreductase [Alphaproteobacteria bacterium]|nr:FAD-dependent oxidoreductase [Alphaproteobacteria bacterium]
MNYVIIGAGPSGVVAAETLRNSDPNGKITLIGEEAFDPYSRMAIPYYLTGNIEAKGTYLRKSANHFVNRGIEVVQAKVTKVSSGEKVVSLDNGTSISYDKLLVATGSHPLKPPVDGLDQPGVHHCWTLDDAKNIIELAHEGADVVLMGAGFIGCIILEALALRNVNLTVVEMGDRMVPRMMDETAGGMLKKWCENKGVTVHTGTRVTKLESSGRSDEDNLLVDLENGEQIPAHLVVVATGVKSNMSFLEGSGVETDQGILVDDHLETNVEGIYAAGDVAQGLDFSTGGRSVHAIQPTSADHGRIAGLNMAGTEAAYKGSLSMNVLDTIGLVSCSFGQWQGAEGGETASAVDEENFKYIKLQFKEDKLVGAIVVGRTEHIGALRGLIQAEIPLGDWKDKLVEDPHQIMDAWVARGTGLAL